MSIFNSGIGTVAANKERELRNALVERYSRLFEKRDAKGKVIQRGVNLLEGLEGHTKENVAFLLENQASYLNHQRKMNESTTSQSSGSYETVSFTMVRRIFDSLLVNEIASVQAMTAPSTTLFFFYPQISERIEDVDGNGNPVSGHASPFARNLASCVGANCPDATFENCKSLYDRYYDDGLFDHSKGRFTIITATGETVDIDRNGCTVPATSLMTYSDGTIRHVKMAVSGFDGDNTQNDKGVTARLGLSGGRGLEIDTDEFIASFEAIYVGAAPIVDGLGNQMFASGDSIPYRFIAQRYSKQLTEFSNFCNDQGQLLIELEFVQPIHDCDTCPTADGFIGASTGTTLAPTDIAFAWRRYDDLEESTEVGQVSFTINKFPISATPRKLNARWTPELAADVNAYHSIDAEAELTALLSQQIAMEIDREALITLKKSAAWKRNWDFLGWRAQGSQKYTEKEWKQTLITVINQISAQIHKATLRGGANFVVVSSEVSALLDDLEMFYASDAEASKKTYNLGMRNAGTIKGRYKVYVDPYAKAGDILIGHKGTSILDTGFIYAPYIPVELSPVLQDTNNFTFVRQISTRYAMKVVNNRYYGFIRVSNIPTFDTNELR